MNTANQFGVAGAKLDKDGRISSYWGLKGGAPSPGFRRCDACDGVGQTLSRSLSERPCPVCNGSGELRV